MRPIVLNDNLDTFRALHEHEHKLACYCATCDRWAVLDLERLTAEGRGAGVLQLRAMTIEVVVALQATTRLCGPLRKDLQ